MTSIFYVIVTLTLSKFAAGKSNIEQKILPSATLTWEEALLAQLRLLHKGDVRGCFAFASKESIGGLENFENMLRIYYGTMVDSEWYTEQPNPSRSTATSACALVMVGKGSRVDKFEWCLSQQSVTASCPKCWMTDSVMPVGGDYTLPPETTVATTAQSTSSMSAAHATSAITEPVTSEATENGAEQHLQPKTSKPHRPPRHSEEQTKPSKQHGHRSDENEYAHHPGDHTYHKSNQHHYHDHHDGDHDHYHHGDHDYHHRDKDYHHDHHHHGDHDHHHDHGHDSKDRDDHHGHHYDHHLGHHHNNHQEEKVVHETKTLSQPVKIFSITFGLIIICSLVATIVFFCCKLCKKRQRAQVLPTASEVVSEELDKGAQVLPTASEVASEELDKGAHAGIALDVSSKPLEDDDVVVLVVGHGCV